MTTCVYIYETNCIYFRVIGFHDFHTPLLIFRLWPLFEYTGQAIWFVRCAKNSCENFGFIGRSWARPRHLRPFFFRKMWIWSRSSGGFLTSGPYLCDKTGWWFSQPCQWPRICFNLDQFTVFQAIDFNHQPLTNVQIRSHLCICSCQTEFTLCYSLITISTTCRKLLSSPGHCSGFDLWGSLIIHATHFLYFQPRSLISILLHLCGCLL